MTKLCESIDTLSMAYLDDELAAEELRDLELHLLDCADCRAHVDGEREAIAELRRRIAAPPCPDVVRARLIATLDTEDAITAREERGQRFSSWMLPGAASLVAVAALAVFVVFGVFGRSAPRGTRSAPSIAEQVVGQQMNAPRVGPSMGRMPPGQMDVGTGELAPNSIVSVDKIAAWDSRLRDRDVASYLFQVNLASREELAIQASVFDARGFDLTEGRGERVRTSGLDLRYGYTQTGVAMVIYQSANGLAYVFSTTDLTAETLVRLVESEDLVTRVAPPR